MVMGVDSYFEGRMLESLYTVYWMDIFSHVYALSCLFEKTKRYVKEAGDGPFKNQQLFHTCNADLLSSESEDDVQQYQNLASFVIKTFML